MTQQEVNPDPRLEEIERRIHDFAVDVLLEGQSSGGDPLENNAFDSLALEQLLDHLEETYRILFDPEDISRENLKTVKTAARMVHARILAVETGATPW